MTYRLRNMILAAIAGLLVGGIGVFTVGHLAGGDSSTDNTGSTEFVLVVPSQDPVYGVTTDAAGSYTCDTALGADMQVLPGGSYVAPHSGTVASATVDEDHVRLTVRQPDRDDNAPGGLGGLTAVIVNKTRVASIAPEGSFAAFLLEKESWGEITTINVCGGGQ